MILVTGAAGFIGSNFVKYLNNIGITDICVSDYLTNGKQFVNLIDCEYEIFITPDKIDSHFLSNIKTVHHFGAISDTTAWNGEIVLERNYNFTVELISRCVSLGIPISYSSSASVYGNGNGPLNLYAYSKWLVDKWVSTRLNKQNVNVKGYRYFNVYGDREWHKGSQASPFYKFEQQALDFGKIEIFKGSDEFKRDFVRVNDICEIHHKLADINICGIFDVGSGKQMSFTEVANQVALMHDAKVVEIEFPASLEGRYQTNTLADMTPIFDIASKNNIHLDLS